MVISQYANSAIKFEKPISSNTGKWPIFKNRYYITKQLGSGKTSKVYLAHDVNDPSKKVAIKILRDDFLKRHNNVM